MLYPILALGAALAAAPLPTIPVGGPALAFTLPAANPDVARRVAGGEQVSLHDFTGVGAPRAQDVVVVHFFQRGAGDDVLADLSRLDGSSDRVLVLGVMADPRGLAAVTPWISAQALSFPVLYDEYAVVFGRYGAGSGPLTLVIDGEGQVRAMGQPTDGAFSSDLNKLVAGLLGK
ncbi:TlpA family protein disulfide reductase [Myxococcota bacterium]|nr:TlpA family protein disulfide reductase [Myxococcota bacterium]